MQTLRELHSGERLILYNSNILYTHHGSSFMNTEIKHLPHIHLSQIFITDRCLGKGAFGEVWCGIVRNEDGTDESVAIKVEFNLKSFDFILTQLIYADFAQRR